MTIQVKNHPNRLFPTELTSQNAPQDRYSDEILEIIRKAAKTIS